MELLSTFSATVKMKLEGILETCLHRLVSVLTYIWPHYRKGIWGFWQNDYFTSPSAGRGRGINYCTNLGQMVLSGLQETVQTEKWQMKKYTRINEKHTYSGGAMTATDSQTFSRLKSWSGNREARQGGAPLCMALQSGCLNPPRFLNCLPPWRVCGFLIPSPKKLSSLYGWQGEKDNECTKGGSVKKVPLCLRPSAALFIYVSKGQMEWLCNVVHHINSFEKESLSRALGEGSSESPERCQQEVWYVSLWTTAVIWLAVLEGERLCVATSHVNLRLNSRFTWHVGICTKCFPLPCLPK